MVTLLEKTKKFMTERPMLVVALSFWLEHIAIAGLFILGSYEAL